MKPQRIDVLELPETQQQAFHRFSVARAAENFPEDPAIPFSDWLERFAPVPQAHGLRFAVMRGPQIIGVADADWWDDEEENPHLARISLSVAPEFRRHGHGSRLLLSLLEAMQLVDRRMVLGQTYDHSSSAGREFAVACGAKLGLETHVNQLLLCDLDRGYLERALRRAPTERYRLLWFDSHYPDDEPTLERLCAVFASLNSAPKGNLELNDWRPTPNRLRAEAAESRRRSLEWWLCIAEERTSGAFVGFTEAGWYPSRPHLVQQYGTGVLPAQRGQGLGAWLKAAMLERLLREHRVADRVRTSNADANAQMLHLNTRLGFRPYMARSEWQLETVPAIARLQQRLKNLSA